MKYKLHLIFFIIILNTIMLIQCNFKDNKVCDYNGTAYNAGETFDATDGCNTCTCNEDGIVLCTMMACTDDN